MTQPPTRSDGGDAHAMHGGWFDRVEPESSRSNRLAPAIHEWNGNDNFMRNNLKRWRVVQ